MKSTINLILAVVVSAVSFPVFSTPGMTLEEMREEMDRDWETITEADAYLQEFKDKIKDKIKDELVAKFAATASARDIGQFTAEIEKQLVQGYMAAFFETSYASDLVLEKAERLRAEIVIKLAMAESLEFLSTVDSNSRDHAKVLELAHEKRIDAACKLAMLKFLKELFP